MENNIGMDSPLLQLALLESLKANKISDEIDLFLPFIAVTVSELSKPEIYPEDLQSAIENRFGFNVPISAVKVFMTRAKVRGILKKENNAFIPVYEKVEEWKNGFHEKREYLSTALTLLKTDFAVFSKDRFNKDLTSKECETLIFNFIEKNISCVTSHNKYETASLLEKIKNTDHIAASFVSYIHKNRTASLEHFGICVKGMLLSNYLFFADKVGQKKKYEALEIYLDTPLIIGLLGFNGSQRKNAIHELISLLKAVKATINIFDITLDETESVLTAWKIDLQKRNYNNFNTKTLEFLRSSGYDAERLESEIKLLKASIENIGINIKYGFRIKSRFQCDERGLESAFSEIFGERKNLSHDTICISRIYNLREGKLVNTLDEKFSLFVTQNTGIIHVAGNFFGKEIPRHKIPLVVSEQWLTAMFWLKKPEIASALPVDQMLATAYGLLYTDDKFWNSFISRLDGMSKRGEISSEDYIHIRWDSDLLGLIHDISVEVGVDFTDEDIFDIVGNIKKKHIAEKDKEIEVLKAVSEVELSKIRSEVLSLTKSNINTESKIRKFVEKVSSFVALIFAGMIFLIICLAAYSTLPGDIFVAWVSPEFQKLSIVSAAIVIAVLFGLVATVSGVNVHIVYLWVYNYVYEKLIGIFITNKFDV